MPFLEEHNTIQSNYLIVPQNYQIDIDQQYASAKYRPVSKMKDELPVKRYQRGFKLNESKTEQYTTQRANCGNRWRDCKIR